MKHSNPRGYPRHDAKASSHRNRPHLQQLADALCQEAVTGDISARHHDLSHQVIDLLIERNPSCPRWASRAVDQLLHVAEVI
ncbi:hypothetical protein ACLM45_12920 [Synechococcus sp. A10-1-5-9]|uniref:hypothetical protein n=1 Tax=Synechococcus sp. A10-1-5-9 TaxID=3392295 RepID=UPI0039E8DD0F